MTRGFEREKGTLVLEEISVFLLLFAVFVVDGFCLHIELENERKGETAQEINRNIPKAFQEYLLERKKQIELQKTIPVGLNQFYKKELNDYFRRLSSEN